RGRAPGLQLHPSRPDPGGVLHHLPRRARHPPAGPVRKGRAMMKLLAALVALAALAFVPAFAGPYPLGLGIGILGYGVLATAWALFSGPTRYISLATVAFYGIGSYSVAVLAELMPYWLVLVVAGLIGLAIAVVVGLATLRE